MFRRSVLAALFAIGLCSTAQADQEAGSPLYSVHVDYMLKCQGCHLPNGEGYPERYVPRLTGEMGKFLNVEGGRAYLVQVPGSATSDLSDERLAGVLNWMLETFSPDQVPDDFQPYRAAEIAELRADPLLETIPVRAALIEEITAWEAAQTQTEAEDDEN